jgi:hypothetical protein
MCNNAELWQVDLTSGKTRSLGRTLSGSTPLGYLNAK